MLLCACLCFTCLQVGALGGVWAASPRCWPRQCILLLLGTLWGPLAPEIKVLGVLRRGKAEKKEQIRKGMLSLLAQREAACPLPRGSTEPGRRLGCREAEAEEEGG